VRVGVALPVGSDASLRRLAGRAEAAEAAGVDLLWLAAPSVGQPLHAVAALAAVTTNIRLAACLQAGPYPLAIAEAAAVADNCCGGRLVLSLSANSGDSALLTETADVLLAATALRPFAHRGERWTIPALLPENDGTTPMITLTPPCVQLELPIWLTGSGAAGPAVERGLAWVRSESETTAGPEPLRVRRPALRQLNPGDDADALVRRLVVEQRAWGLDLAILHPAADLDDAAWEGWIRRVATRIRPRVIQDSLPDGLEEHWHTLNLEESPI
jgi:alkanesulfonate monooxygenase SsuD/methylene tetrahydromethanopterin reductase-like flavin-dependent oxidoreductase (luciferase family)